MAKFSLFGFQLGKETPAKEVLPSFSAPVLDDGAVTISAAAHYGTTVDLDSNYKNEVELITRYREMAMQPEIESAIDDIINEAIIQDRNKGVKLILDDVKASPKVKKAIEEEFDNILTLLNFKNLGQDIFRRYYVDGRLFYNIILDKESPQSGIQELRYTDPRKLSKIREIKKIKDKTTGFDIVAGYNEYYIYSDTATTKSNLTNSGVRIAPDSIISVTSGLLDSKRSIVLSYLHKCIEKTQRVKTKFGWKEIQDIKNGDEIYSFDIENNTEILTEVKNVWCTGKKEIVKIRTKHTELLCTNDHPILVKDKKTNTVSYIEPKDIVTQKHQLRTNTDTNTFNYLPFPTLSRKMVTRIKNPNEWVEYKYKGKKQLIFSIAEKLNINKHSVYSFIYGYKPLEIDIAESIVSELPIKLELTNEEYFGYYQHILTLPEFIDEEFAQLFGFLLGDGWVNKYTVGFSEGIYENRNKKYVNLLEKYFGNCSRIVSNTKKSDYHSYYTNNTLAAELLKEMGFISGARNKRIPEWVYNSPKSIQIAFIDGLHDADGCERLVSEDGNWITSTFNLANEYLIKDIKELWTRIGYCSGKISRYEQKTTHILGVKLQSTSDVWSIYINKKALPEWENIIDISNEEMSEVFDIEVNNENHNFITNGIVVHNCIKPLNQLRMIEDATVIYKVSRAPERRIFYIDVGNLPKMKAEQYLKDIMTKYKNKVVYDANSGEVRDDRRYLSMQEDFWLPRRDGKGTEISTLPSSAAFDDMSMVQYFEQKLYKALNVPYSRLHQPDTVYDIGNSDQISRDEIKFDKFVNRLRLKFADLFDQALRIQCYLKGICSQEEFDEFRQNIFYDFLRDNNYAELRESQLLQNRMAVLGQVDPYVGKYYSMAWIQKNVLQFEDDDIEQIQKEIEEEIAQGLYPDPKAMNLSPDLGLPQDQTDQQTQDNQQDSESQQNKQLDNQQSENPYYNA